MNCFHANTENYYSASIAVNMESARLKEGISGGQQRFICQQLNGSSRGCVSAFIMIKITGTALVAAALLTAGTAFANDKAACCAKSAANDKAMCADFASLNVTADQKSKLEAWQADCMKAGCTKESRAKFLKQARGILSKDQYAALKAECEKSGNSKKTRT